MVGRSSSRLDHSNLGHTDGSCAVVRAGIETCSTTNSHGQAEIEAPNVFIFPCRQAQP